MKRTFLITAVLSIALFVMSCGSTDERDPNTLIINGENKSLGVGYLGDEGTNTQISYRKYSLEFADKEEFPANYISFSIFSNSTTRLNEGVYEYNYGYESGAFSDLNLGHDIKYDSQGVAVSGTRINEYYMDDIQGTVTVSMEDGDYKFDFNISFTYNDRNYVVKGVFWDVLKPGYL
jgi:hypothetical protein